MQADSLAVATRVKIAQGQLIGRPRRRHVNGVQTADLLPFFASMTSITPPKHSNKASTGQTLQEQISADAESLSQALGDFLAD